MKPNVMHFDETGYYIEYKQDDLNTLCVIVGTMMLGLISVITIMYVGLK